MKRRLMVLAVVLVLMAFITTSVAAQDYSFSLPQETVHVFLNEDGTIRLEYVFMFKNDSSGHVIDFVDVGMPNDNYDSNSITADVNGKPVSISTDYQGQGSSGFSVDMGPYAIQPGQSGKVHVVVGSVGKMFYPDSNDSSYASSEFSPTWFGSQYVHGSTDLTVVLHLPAGVQPDEPRYHMPSNWVGASEPQAGIDSQGRVTYTWNSADANGSTQYTFGASFPAKYVAASAIVQSNPLSDFLGALFSGIAGVFSFAASSLPCLIIGFFIFGVPIIGAVQGQRRKLQYLPPKISIEGHGIKRGLTAVEAAILMQEPLDKVMTMILFGVIKKGAAEVVTRDPLKLKVEAALPEDLRDYETDFVKAFQSSDKTAQRKALQDMTVKLIKSVGDKMKGFSRKETVDYYKTIMERAWQQVESADTPEVKSKMLDDSLEWTMLDRNFDDRTRRTFTGPVYVPMWWGRYDPTWSHTGGGVSTPSVPSASSGRSPGGLPGSAFAASMVTGMQHMSSSVIGNVNSFTNGVTSVTNPPPPPSRSGGSYHGGGGCACACACAGCACACAGGGR
jgi:hypothetical protein